MIRVLLAGAALAAVTGLALVATPVTSAEVPAAAPDAPAAVAEEPRARPAQPRATPLPLAGVRIALDPGHQLGNARFPDETGRLVDAGGFSKPCNSTGTATSSGYPEASLTFAVATRAKARLEALGATVVLTRAANSNRLWGPCVDARGRFGAAVGADLTVSIHGDGAASGARGFHVIAPTVRSSRTAEVAAGSRRLALALRDAFAARGVPRADYVGGGTGLVTRSDLGTLNLSDVPVALVEVGNMRNARDAARMTTVAGRVAYAVAVVEGIRGFLGR